MKPAPFRYHDPATVEEVVELLGSLGDVKVLAGGQSLVPMLNMRFLMPDHVVDINKIASLAGIADEGARIRIGAMTRQRDLAGSPVIAERLPVMIEALAQVGHFQTRNRGTIGGSLCHLDPAAELPVVAALYDAEITVQGPEGERTARFAEWPLAYMMASLAPEELATSIAFAPWSGRHGSAFVEFARRHGDFAIVAVGVLMALAADGSIDRVAVAVGGADQVVRRLGDVEAALTGQPASEQTFEEGARTAGTMETMGDAYVSAGYRQRLVRVLTARALATAARRAEGAAL